MNSHRRDRFRLLGSTLFVLPAIASLWGTSRCVAQVTLSASQLNFGSPYVSQPVTGSLALTNTSNAAVYLFPAALNGDFSDESNCPSHGAGISFLPFPTGVVCSIQVRFNPSTVGNQTQTLSIGVYSQSNLNASSLIQQIVVLLTGTALLPVTISPNPLNFGYVLFGHSSPPLPITIKNVGVVPIFLETCGGTRFAPVQLSPGQSCTQALNFNSTVLGPETSIFDILVYTDPNLGELLGMVPLTLAGIGHPIFVNSTYDAGIVQIGTTATLKIVVSNAGTIPVKLEKIGIAGANFALAPLSSGSCVDTIPAPGADCFIFVTYTPTMAIVNSGTLNITDDDATSPQVVQLTGTGSAVKLTFEGPALSTTFSATFDFGNEYLDSLSSPSRAILTNTGPVPVLLKDLVYERRSENRPVNAA
jgi:hypothetical protein